MIKRTKRLIDLLSWNRILEKGKENIAFADFVHSRIFRLITKRASVLDIATACLLSAHRSDLTI